MINKRKFKTEDFYLVCGYIQGRLIKTLINNEATASFDVITLKDGAMHGFKLKVNNIAFRAIIKIVNDNFHNDNFEFSKLMVTTGNKTDFVDLTGKPLSYLIEKIEEVVNGR